MIDEHIYDPLKSYKRIYRDLHNENVTKYFDSLVEKANINIEENKETVKKLNKTIEAAKDVNKQISKLQGFRVFFIVLIVLGFLSMIYFIGNLSETDNFFVTLLIAIGSGVAAVGLLLLVLKKMNPLIKKIKEDKDFLEKSIKLLTNEAYNQVNPLNNLFNNEQHLFLFRQTIPIINLDSRFDIKRYEYLVQKFGLDTSANNNRSTLYVKSGDISGNPFYIANDLVTVLGTKRYSGSTTITYTTYTTINGKRVARTNTQTLTAYVDKPYPYYNEQSYILYGNEAAPDLSFSRTDSDAENMNQKQIDREVTKVEKKLKKKSRKSISKGGDYTVMTNSEFEVLWHATDRDHEVQFRLLFTPLAQKQLLELMKEKEVGFGDNFDFIKSKKINIVIPEHLQLFNIDVTKEQYYHYDYNEIKKRFININNEFLRHIYFGFAPLLSIPLYQQHKPHEYIYQDLYKGYISFYEHEMVINKLGERNFAHVESNTRNILKTTLVNSNDHKDSLNVTAYGYKTINRTDYVSKMGADGRSHRISIHWVEYIPVEQTTTVEINVEPEEQEENARTRIENLFKKIQERDKLSERELYIIGKYVTRIIK